MKCVREGKVCQRQKRKANSRVVAGKCTYVKVREREGACTREVKGATERARERCQRGERHTKKDERYETVNIWKKEDIH